MDILTSPPRNSHLLRRAAIAYVVRLGKPVVPLCWPDHGDIHNRHRSNYGHKGKVPLINGWQRFCNQLPDVAEIDSWWLRWPEANIGGPTGPLWGVALDIDTRHGGKLELEVRELVIPDTVTNLTGGGGTHHLFQHPGFSVVNSVGLFPGVDIRGDGGQIILPPSFHESGSQYAWEASSRPENTPLALCPHWLLSALSERKTLMAPAGEEPVREGRRNAYLVSLAGAMRRRGFGQGRIEAALQAENASKCTPPLSEAEVANIARSIARYAPQSTLTKSHRSPRRHTPPVPPLSTLTDKGQTS